MNPLLKIPWKAIVMNNSRRLALIIGLMIFWLSSLAHATSFIIELNNGSEITTTHVWKEGDEIKFSIYQGTAGVHRALVKSIQTSVLVYSDRVSRSSIPLSPTDLRSSMVDKTSEKISTKDSEVRQKEGNGEFSREKKYGGETRRQEGASQVDREKKLELTSKLDEATNKYLQALTSGNLDAQKGALIEKSEVSKQIYALADEVKEKNGGILPAWWNE
jgi:hypothetical protein